MADRSRAPPRPKPRGGNEERQTIGMPAGGASNVEKARQYFHQRNPSSGSTMCAFSHPSDLGPKHPHSAKRKKKGPKGNAAEGVEPKNEMNLADVASLALSLEGGFDEVSNVKPSPMLSRLKTIPSMENSERDSRRDLENGLKKNTYDSMQHIRQMSNEVKMFSALAQGEALAPLTPEKPMPKTQYFHASQVAIGEFLRRSCGIAVSKTKELWKYLIWDPEVPELTSLQLFDAAVLIGLFMGGFTAWWGRIIEASVEFVWVDVPEALMEHGIFTDLDGYLPLPHYMWICPAIFGALLSLITVIVPTPIPGQDHWIENLHRIGVQDGTTFFPILVISTLAMASGLSLGPELPLVLVAGMVGSWVGTITRQSVLSARVLNLTAAGAAIGGFFGFPMAGALFVLELPHRMGLQYFEALSPSTIASIVAVLVNRMVTKNEVKGYFNYPFLNATLPSHIYYVAIADGLVGTLFGILYTVLCKKLKTWVHDWFHEHDDHHSHQRKVQNDDGRKLSESTSESTPLIDAPGTNGVSDRAGPGFFRKLGDAIHKILSFNIKNEPVRATVVGFLAGAIVGVFCMFFPILLFWGEGQLQTVIDNGKTRLPFFGYEDEPTAPLTAYGYCFFDPEAEDNFEGFSVACLGLFTVLKIVVVGISLGTGVIGGHFWGPLFVGAAGANFFTGFMKIVYQKLGFGEPLASYPCVTLLCVMGSTHVVVYRAHIAIMLILTLTITAFESDIELINDFVGGDYSAVFPLLVVSCFISLMLSRSFVFYKKQRSRGDIIATPEVLCEPKKEGQPEYPMHMLADDMSQSSYTSSENASSDDDSLIAADDDSDYETEQPTTITTTVKSNITSDDIEQEFARKNSYSLSNTAPLSQDPKTVYQVNDLNGEIPLATVNQPQLSKIDQILNTPLPTTARSSHRRHHSDMAALSSYRKSRNRTGSVDKGRRRAGSRDRGRERSTSGGNSRASGQSTPTGGVLMRVSSFGEVKEFQPSLTEQARVRASSAVVQRGAPSPARSASPVPPDKPLIKRISKSRHGRKLSGASGSGAPIPTGPYGAVSQDDIERAFSSVQNQLNLGPGM